MKRKFLSVLLVLAMCLSLTPTFALADDATGSETKTNSSVASVVSNGTTTYYDTFSAAVTAAVTGDTIALVADTTTAYNYTNGKTITLDLAGHTLTGTSQWSLFYVGNSSSSSTGDKLTITNSGSTTGKIVGDNGSNKVVPIYLCKGNTSLVIDGNVEISGTHDGGVIAVQEGNASVELKNGTIKGTYGVTVYREGSKFTMTGGTIEATGIGVSGNGSTGLGGTTINITGGTIKGGCGIFHPQNGTLTVSGNTTIEGNPGIQVCSGTATISGNVTVTNTGTDNRSSKEGDGNIDDGSAISVVNRSYPGGAPTVKIEGGSFSSTNSAVLAYSWTNSDEAGNSGQEWSDAAKYITITGGTYSSDPSGYVPSTHCVSTSSPYTVTQHKSSIGSRVVTEATCAEAGVSETYCTNCGETVSTATIAATGHTWGETYTSQLDGTHTQTCTVCGAVSDPADCADSDNDNVCDVCGYVFPTTSEDGSTTAETTVSVVESAAVDTEVNTNELTENAVSDEAVKAIESAASDIEGTLNNDAVSVVDTSEVDNAVSAPVADEDGNLTVSAGDETITVTSADVADAVAELEGAETAEDVVAVVVPEVKVSVSDIAADEDGTVTSVSFDISAYVTVYITTKEAYKDGFDEEQAVPVTDSVSLKNISKPIEINLPVPSSMNLSSGVTVRHQKDDGRIYYHPGTYNSSKKIVSFVNDRGFSTFTIYAKDAEPVENAQYGDARYATLQEAVDAAIADGVKETIIVVYEDDDTAVVNAEITITLDGPDGVYYDDRLTAGNGYTLTMDGERVYIFTKTSTTSGGGSGSGSSSSGGVISGKVSSAYSVSVDSTSGGTIGLSTIRATKGDTVTVRINPKTGYKLSDLTVTSSSGSNVEVTKVDDNTYTFVMPSGTVKVTPKFVVDGESSETPDETPRSGFEDVPDTSAFSYSVAWAVEQGIAEGYEDGTFGPKVTCTHNHILTFLWRSQGSPDAEGEGDFEKALAWAIENGIADADVDGDAYCTRADAVTYMWRLAGSPEVDDSASFLDVDADAEYADAVAWALSNNITTGVTPDYFEPDTICNRGQIVTFLYRAYA